MESQGTLNAANVPCGISPVATRATSISWAGPKRIYEWWSSWRQDALTRKLRKQTALELSALDDQVLQDIGVPESLLAETHAVRQLEQNRRAFWLWS